MLIKQFFYDESVRCEGSAASGGRATSRPFLNRKIERRRRCHPVHVPQIFMKMNVKLEKRKLFMKRQPDIS
jgi:hypothetical protein